MVNEKYWPAEAQKASIVNTVTTISTFCILVSDKGVEIYIYIYIRHFFIIVNWNKCWLCCGYHLQYQTLFMKLACNSGHSSLLWFEVKCLLVTMLQNVAKFLMFSTLHSYVSPRLLLIHAFSSDDGFHLRFKPCIIQMCGLGSSVGTATDYRLDGPGIESQWRARFSAPV
jgi:hypothetical protein